MLQRLKYELNTEADFLASTPNWFYPPLSASNQQLLWLFYTGSER